MATPVPAEAEEPMPVPAAAETPMPVPAEEVVPMPAPAEEVVPMPALGEAEAPIPARAGAVKRAWSRRRHRTLQLLADRHCTMGISYSVWSPLMVWSSVFSASLWLDKILLERREINAAPTLLSRVGL